MFDKRSRTIDWGGRPLKIETGGIARQADGAVVVTYGETQVLCTVVGAKNIREDIDFFPLTVNYTEKAYAAGKIPGGFFKREGRPTEKETLVSRLIDRPIRPIFPDGFYNEVQVICNVLSHDLENDPDIPAIIGTSAAITLSGIPFYGPIGAARVGMVDKKLILNPIPEQLENSTLDLVVSGTRDGILMVESEAHELTEKNMLEAVMFGHKEQQKIIEIIIDLAEEIANEPWELPVKKDNTKAKDLIEKNARSELEKAYKETTKQTRQLKLATIRESITLKAEENEIPLKMALEEFKKCEKDIVRGSILKSGKRIDGRDLKTVRPIQSEVSVLKRTHGSAVFTRGETQALVAVTLGTGQDEQIVDALDGEYRERFMLHYNFPPYSVGEAGRYGFTGRREIGHGKLAWRAVHPILPDKEDFPYSIRVVSEITESNGSSSMATVCGSSLALMDAGVPLSKPVAGIAMGLIKEKSKFAVLSDILGDEDHLGDMDFKVAGTKKGITSLQMDIKITSITKKIMEEALSQAREGRLHILDEMSKVIKNERKELSVHAPKIKKLSIPVDKIREVIGSGGKVIREICETSGSKVDIEDDGSIKISSNSQEAIDNAFEQINNIVAEPEVGKIYSGKVVKVVDFGAFVNFFGKRDGLVHISALSDERVERVTDVVKEGDNVKVKVINFDNRGKVRLSMKVVNQDTGEDLTNEKRKS